VTVKRATRVAGRLREELARVVRDLRDPRVRGAVVTRVEVTDDLQSAKVFVRHELGLSDEAARQTMLRGLAAAGGRIRGEVSRSLALRYAPTFRFLYDEAPDAMDRIEELLREVRDDDDERRR
jgi:ribosome-binding factor A